MPPTRIAIIGMGGFAGVHHATIARLEERGHARLVCTCDPQLDVYGTEQLIWKFPQRGVGVFADYRQMLEARHRDLDLVVIPTPIQLHHEMHAVATAYGLPCYLEKPPTLDYLELEQMIAHDARLTKASFVGFNFIIEPMRLALKERMLAGEFGALQVAKLAALWPRPVNYFSRAPWAGRLFVNDRLVLDSCFGNAFAHFIHNLLFWAGHCDLFSWAQIAATRAEIYRAHAIEGADTFFVEADTASGINLRIAVSHACAGASSQVETLICEKATIRYLIGQTAEVRWNDGRLERLPLEPFDPIYTNHLEYFRYLAGESPRPATTLADSRPFVALNDLAYVSSRHITPIAPSRISSVRDEKEQKDYLSVAGLPAAQEDFLCRGLWPSAQGWDRPAGDVVTLGDLARFHETVRLMAGR